MAITPARALGLTPHHPSAGICVVAVNGELDMLTAPLLGTCVRQLLATTPAHLILDLQPLRFLGVSGLTYLLYVQELAQQPPEFRLHLTGLANRVVARPLELTGVVKLFDTYPTLADGLAALTNDAFIEVHQPLGAVDDHQHPIPLPYQGAPVPQRMNQLGAAGKPIPDSLYRPDPAEEIAVVQQAARDGKPH